MINDKSREAFTEKYCAWYLDYYDKPPVWEDHIDFTRYVAFKAGAAQQHQEPREMEYDGHGDIIPSNFYGPDGAYQDLQEDLEICQKMLREAEATIAALQPIPTEVKRKRETFGSWKKDKTENNGALDDFFPAVVDYREPTEVKQTGGDWALSEVEFKKLLRQAMEGRFAHTGFAPWFEWCASEAYSKMLPHLQPLAEPAQPNLEEMVVAIHKYSHELNWTQCETAVEALSNAGYLKGEK